MNDLIGDNRYRVHKSEKLWIVTGRSLSGEEIFGIQEPIQRVVYGVIGFGKYVQYCSRLHRLHSEEEFQSVIQRSLKGYLYFYSNWHGVSGRGELKKNKKLITLAPFIYEHDFGLKQN